MERLRQGIYRNGRNQEQLKSPEKLSFGGGVMEGTFSDPVCDDLAQYFVKAGIAYGEWVGLSVHHILRMVLQEVGQAEYIRRDEQSALVKKMLETEKADVILQKLAIMGTEEYLDLKTTEDDYVYFPTKKFVQRLDAWQEIVRKRGV